MDDSSRSRGMKQEDEIVPLSSFYTASLQLKTGGKKR